MSVPTVAVVILNYNGLRYLQQFLPIVEETCKGVARVYVADNASTDGSAAYVQAHHAGVEWIQLRENYGFAQGYNAALQEVVADYYVLLNSDVLVTPNWLEPVIAFLEAHPQVAAAQPKIRSYTDRHLFEHAGGAGGWLDILGYPFCKGRVFFELETDAGQYDEPSSVFWATGAALFVRASLYHQFGGLDADYFAHMEEIDLCWRMKLAGYEVWAVPQSVVYHVGGGTLPASNPHKTYLNFRNGLVTMTKNERVANLMWIVPVRLVLDGVAGARFMWEGKWAEIWAIVRAHWYCFLRIPYLLAKRRKTQQIISRLSCGAPNRDGLYMGSIVYSFFVQGRTTFRRVVARK
jgi:GT2 family glycosyltransferase